MNLYLIGYRGSGKSAVGAALGKMLGREHLDSDELIEQRTGLTIQQIFSTKGEEYFRELETEVIQSFDAAKKLVVSLGGGAILQEENRLWLRAMGRMVWLVASVETLYLRIKADPNSPARRPSLTNLDEMSEIAFVLSEREPIYSLCADFKIEVNDLTIEEVAERIRKWWASTKCANEGLPREK
jgi:shikimate kinase